MRYFSARLSAYVQLFGRNVLEGITEGSAVSFALFTQEVTKPCLWVKRTALDSPCNSKLTLNLFHKDQCHGVVFTLVFYLLTPSMKRSMHLK